MLSHNKASNYEILKFIKLKRAVEPWQLQENFGYTHNGAKTKLKKVVFTIILPYRMINHPLKRHYPIKATKKELLKFIKKRVA